MSKERFEQVIEALNKFADSHYIYFYLAQLYYYGLDGLGYLQNPKLAYQWATKAAGVEPFGKSLRNFSEIKYESLKMIALLEYQGRGVEENKEAAIRKWQHYAKVLKKIIEKMIICMKKMDGLTQVDI